MHKLKILKWPKDNMENKLIMLSGPSGVGKGPIVKWIKKDYYKSLYQVKVQKLKKSERDRIDEKIYLSQEFHEGFDKKRMTYDFYCRGIPQRIDIKKLEERLFKKKTVLLECYYKPHEFLQERYSDIDFRSIFISPIDFDEINLLKNKKDLKNFLVETMFNSLFTRAKEVDTKFIKISLSKDLEKRAKDSIKELSYSKKYDNFIPNHCYESDPRWRLFEEIGYLVGEPKKTVETIYELIKK